MNTRDIEKICKIEFQENPQKIIKKTVGICNEVYEILVKNDNYILRMNYEKESLYGTHKFLPIFQKLEIKTPTIVAEDYSQSQLPFYYQILSKIEGEDLWVIISELTSKELLSIAKDISDIFDKFKNLAPESTFGGITGLDEEKFGSLLEVIEKQYQTIITRNQETSVIDDEIMNILDTILKDYKDYFLETESRLYYDDISSKNVMIYKGKFNGLVDLDFLMKGDYLESIGRIMASWYGEKYGEIYTNEIMRLQNLSQKSIEIVKMYAIFNLIYWLSEEGIKFNSNSSGIVNWDNVKDKKRKILKIYKEII